ETCCTEQQKATRSSPKKKGATRPVAPFELLKNENYQRLRPLLLLSRPPPPRLSRLAIGLASFTVSVRPSNCVPFKASMAFCASLPEPISTKPKPRDWPVNLSEITLADSTVPCA